MGAELLRVGFHGGELVASSNPNNESASLVVRAKRAGSYTIAVSGARGGHTVDFRALAHQGMTLVGLTQSFADGIARFQDNLADNIRRGDENYLALLDAADGPAAAATLKACTSPANCMRLRRL